MNRRKKKKSEDRKRKTQWKVWKKEVVVSLWLHFLLVLDFYKFFFLEYYFFAFCL